MGYPIRMPKPRIRKKIKARGGEFSGFKSVRSPLLTPKLIDQINKHARKGAPLDLICDLVGLSPSTLYSWLRKGQDFLNNDYQPDIHEPYAIFYRELRRAIGKYRLKLYAGLNKKGGDWVRISTILERRDPGNYGRNLDPNSSEEDFNPDARFL